MFNECCSTTADVYVMKWAINETNELKSYKFFEIGVSRDIPCVHWEWEVSLMCIRYKLSVDQLIDLLLFTASTDPKEDVKIHQVLLYWEQKCSGPVDYGYTDSQGIVYFLLQMMYQFYGELEILSMYIPFYI